MSLDSLVEGVDFEINSDGLVVFTKHYLLKRGYCCESGCKNCPYKDQKIQKSITEVKDT